MIEITHEPLDAEAVTWKVLHDAAGAVVTFLGVTRDHTGDRKVLFLEYEAYRPMADQQLARVAEEMMERWDLKGEDAYEASEYSISRIKQIVPIWKKEFFEGGGVWVGSQEEFDPLAASSYIGGDSN